MNNHTFLQKYYNLQKDIMFDEVLESDKYTICFSEGDSHSFWNNALVNEVIDEETISEVETKLKTLDRKPAIYFENNKQLQPLIELLTKLDYKKVGEDSWMFFDNREIDYKLFPSVRKVSNEKDLNDFLDTFSASYRSDDPKNPYGELGEYLEVAKESWNKHNKNGKLEYFIAYKNNDPVSVSTLTNYKGIGYISNVGSILDIRGEGYGKIATLYCVEASKKNGNVMHCLATEEGTNPNQFYDALGFKTRFTSLLLTK